MQPPNQSPGPEQMSYGTVGVPAPVAAPPALRIRAAVHTPVAMADRGAARRGV
ncbi:hypothetical protein I2W78_37755 [Streptomyces spinoverrucosus]|uniref:hypothetical protein n=1 Tax=Streptomyces spinoverrucosus TaxID=284043 RepID=UPI0018C449ED|nr:hypothetical protein [Streptomyces spinoverrucosus]MBG0857441.1 hypothetical protein [Streptomyces spinoverrucosus]